jgi:electron transfer flavoprotein alpha subunit
MSHKISDDCVGCSACVSSCPQEAIVANGDKYKILKDKCIDCGNCVSVCPVGAISKE